jgi:outer membrane cobalamin receptor
MFYKNLSRRFLISTFSLLLILSLSSFTFASDNPTADGKITGRVLDAGDDISIPYATVALYSKPDSTFITGTATDDEGRFSLDDVDDGNYYLVINFIGYSKQIISDLTVIKGKRKIDLGTVKLSKATQALDEVEITAERNAVQYKIDKKVVHVSKNLSATGSSLTDALENVPSIQTDAEGNLTLRGSSNFTVLIDGKPTALSGSDALKQIPATAVENVEIITNPSAKYDPDGTAGIINIIMKKEYQTGLNGIVNASVGTQWKNSGDFTFNYRTDKANYFVSSSYRDFKSYPTTIIDAHTNYNDTIFHVIQDADRMQYQNPYNVKAGSDFYLSDKHTLSLSGAYGHWGFGLDMDAKVTETTQPESETVYKNTITNLSTGGEYINGTLTFDSKFGEKHSWTNTLYVSKWNGGSKSLTDERITDSQWNLIKLDKYRGNQASENYEIRAKSDYTIPLGENGKLETGYQLRKKDEDGSYRFENYDNLDELWENNPQYTNTMKFVRSIHALYGTYGNELAGFQYQIGLRGEYTDRLLKQITTEDDFDMQSFELFPSVHISRELPKLQQIQASYSRRVNRPEIWNLNPFPIFSDSYVMQKGNPYLLPEFTNSYELNYMKRSQIGFVAVEAYYRQTTDSHDQTIRLNDEGIILVTTENLANTYAYGAELSGNFRYKKWLNIYASANVYNYSIEGEILSPTADVSSLKTDFRLNTTFTVKQNTRIQLTGFYNAPTITSQGLRSEIFGMNAAINQNFFDNKLTATISGRNILNTMKFEFYSETENMRTDFNFNMEYPVVIFSLSYKINNYKQRREDMENQGGPSGGGII